jgi:sec-independent protein translocase protein TatA
MTLFTLLFGMPGTQELLLIGAIMLLLFGGTKIPSLMKGLGQGIREFKNAKDGIGDATNKITKE